MNTRLAAEKIWDILRMIPMSAEDGVIRNVVTLSEGGMPWRPEFLLKLAYASLSQIEPEGLRPRWTPEQAENLRSHPDLRRDRLEREAVKRDVVMVEQYADEIMRNEFGVKAGITSRQVKATIMAIVEMSTRAAQIAKRS